MTMFHLMPRRLFHYTDPSSSCRGSFCPAKSNVLRLFSSEESSFADKPLFRYMFDFVAPIKAKQKNNSIEGLIAQMKRIQERLESMKVQRNLILQTESLPYCMPLVHTHDMDLAHTYKMKRVTTRQERNMRDTIAIYRHFQEQSPIEQSAQDRNPDFWNDAPYARPWVLLDETAQTLEDLGASVQFHTELLQDMKEHGIQYRQWEGHGYLYTSDAELASAYEMISSDQLLQDYADFLKDK